MSSTPIPSLTKLDHIAIVVADTDEALRFYRDTLGLELMFSEVLDDQGVRLTHLSLGNVALQLVQPLREDHPLSAHLSRNGEGLHHLCFEATSIPAAMADCAERGLPSRDATPRSAPCGRRAIFLDPANTRGVLWEITGPSAAGEPVAVQSNEPPAPGAVRKAELIDALPPSWPEDPLPAIRQALASSREKVIVLDDDPTGTQSVHGVPILTRAAAGLLRDEFDNDMPAVYILTNSRSMTEPDACALSREIGRQVRDAAESSGRPAVVISRSDSTLRGHFPAEVDALAGALGGKFDLTLIAPAFIAGGRYTIDDVHYVAEGDWLIPAAQSPYATDAAFGFRHSNLKEWIEEKTGGAIPAGRVASIALGDIRTGGPEAVTRQLIDLPAGSVCIVNAADERDLEVVALASVRVGAAGRRLICRTAASFVRARAGIDQRPLLSKDDLDLPAGAGGLIVVGSYVPRTSRQIDELLKRPDLAAIEIDVQALLDDQRAETVIATAVQAAESALRAGRDAVVYTSRDLVRRDDGADNLTVGRRVSDALVRIVRGIETRPRYLLAKGGITASDLATEALGVGRAMVAGQLLPGVPVWRLGDESRWPGMSYIVFPGNVGDAEAVAEAVSQLRHAG